MKADHEAAYKQLPLAPKDQPNAIIALFCPDDGKRYGFTARTPVFGDTAAVLHYNVFFRLIAALVNQLLGIPLICFIDDCAALVPKILENKALQAPTSFWLLLGPG